MTRADFMRQLLDAIDTAARQVGAAGADGMCDWRRAELACQGLAPLSQELKARLGESAPAGAAELAALERALAGRPPRTRYLGVQCVRLRWRERLLTAGLAASEGKLRAWVFRRFRVLSGHVDDLWQELCGRVLCAGEPMMPDNVEAYCMRIMRNLAIKRWDEIRRRREVPLHERLPDSLLARAEERADLRLAVNALPPDEKAAVDLRLAGCTARESAARLQVSQGTVERWLSNALAQLREELLARREEQA
jgi:RNA polymerase sigma factor (sigma-70 family)